MAILAAVSWSVPAFAQAAAPANSAASAPGPVERAENATKKAVKATKKAGGKAVTATKKGAKKASDAITRTGKKIEKKIPRTKAYEKKQADQAAPATDAK
ncbi:hypothetical protein [Rhodoferax ferrireducens]|uniref:hypothetical protein n=1 Tax=Rhodoferax ferrireducens TaxID=192843 RepID=UPI0013004EF3|nr:hypothetical protein [Rhodoferax ferrireducens]